MLSVNFKLVTIFDKASSIPFLITFCSVSIRSGLVKYSSESTSISLFLRIRPINLKTSLGSTLLIFSLNAIRILSAISSPTFAKYSGLTAAVKFTNLELALMLYCPVCGS